MKNLEYIEAFFKKHKLSGRIKVTYSSPSKIDEFISSITLENGEVINMNDIIFDIESELPEDMLEMWFDARKENDLSFSEWLQTNIHYVPKDMDTSSVDEYRKEMEGLFDQVKTSIDTILNFEPEDSDYEEDEDE